MRGIESVKWEREYKVKNNKNKTSLDMRETTYNLVKKRWMKKM